MWKGALAVVAFVGAVSAEPFVAGRVVDAEGRPVGRAEVAVVRLDARGAAGLVPGDDPPAPLAATIAGEDGRFAIDAAGVEPGLHALRIAAPGRPAFLRTGERIAFGAAALPGDLEPRLPALARVRGIVLDEAGRPVTSRARLLAWAVTTDGVMGWTAFADETGHFELAVPRDAVLTLSAAPQDRWGIVRARVVSADLLLAVHAVPLVLVEGRLEGRDAANAVAPEGIRIRAHAPTWDPVTPTRREIATPPWAQAPVLSESVVDGSGRYALRLPEGGLALSTSPRTLAMRALQGRSPLRAGTPTRGVVVDDRGSPVAGAFVQWSEIADVARTDAQGRFELLPNVNADVIAWTDDGARGAVTLSSIGESARITLPARRAIEGAVVDPESQAPVAGATVRIATATGEVVTATDAAGRFALSLRGATRASASARDRRAEGAVGDGAIDLRLRSAGPGPAAAPAPLRSPLRLTVVDEGGRAIEGVLGRAIATDTTDVPEGPLPTAASSADGVLTLHAEWDEDSDVVLARPGRGLVRIGPLAAGSTTRVVLHAGATLTGSVRAPNGAPVAGAGIIAVSEVSEVRGGAAMLSANRRTVVAGADGAYVLRDMAAGAYAVDVVADGFALPPSSRVVLQPGVTTSLDLVLAEGGTLRGIVRDEAGPVAGAVVRAFERSSSMTMEAQGASAIPRAAYTAEDGSFAIDGLHPDAWHDVMVEAAWHEPGRGGGRPAETALVEVIVQQTGAVHGTVDGDSRGAVVQCESLAPEEAEPKRAAAMVEAGEFTLESVLPGSYRCEIEADLARATIDRVDVRAGSATEVRAQMKDLPSIAVEVREAASGRPIEGAWVSVGFKGGRTDADGRVRVVLPQAEPETGGGEEVSPEILAERDAMLRRVQAQADGHAPAETLLPVPPPASVTLRLKAMPVVRGRVEDAAGLPVAGATIGWNRGPGGATSDEAGQFAIALPPDEEGDLRGDPLVLTATRSRHGVVDSGSAPLPPAGGDVVIRTARAEAAELTVLVTGAAGPIAGARVMVMGADDPFQGVTSAEGRFRASGLSAGHVIVAVEAEEGTATRQLELEAGARATEEIRLGEGWTITGRILRSGRPAEGVQVTWSEREGGFGGTVMSRADGSFELGPVPTETGEVRVMAMDSLRAAASATVRRSLPSATIDVGTSRISGRLVAAGEPVASARIHLSCPDGPGRRATTSDGGTFVLDDAPADRDCELVAQDRDRTLLVLPLRTPLEGARDLGEVPVQEAVVAGRASLPEGSPAKRLTLTLRTSRGTALRRQEAEIGAGGSFEVRLPPGDYEGVVRTDDDDLLPIATPVSGEAPLELRFRRGGSVEIVADASAEGWAQVIMGGEMGDDEWSLVGRPSASLEGGRALLRGVPDGRVRVQVQVGPGDGEPLELLVDVRAGETTRVEVPAR